MNTTGTCCLHPFETRLRPIRCPSTANGNARACSRSQPRISPSKIKRPIAAPAAPSQTPPPTPENSPSHPPGCASRSPPAPAAPHRRNAPAPAFRRTCPPETLRSRRALRTLLFLRESAADIVDIAKLSSSVSEVRAASLCHRRRSLRSLHAVADSPLLLHLPGFAFHLRPRPTFTGFSVNRSTASSGVSTGLASMNPSG